MNKKNEFQINYYLYRSIKFILIFNELIAKTLIKKIQ